MPSDRVGASFVTPRTVRYHRGCPIFPLHLLTKAFPRMSDSGWNRRHLLGLRGMSAAELELIFARARLYKERAARGEPKSSELAGTVVANLFFENSTRTRTSFGLAARRLSADVVDFSASSSSLSKGETFIDTALTIQAMGATQMVVRHSSSGARSFCRDT